METLDHKTDPTKLWTTIKAIDGKSTQKSENETITFDNSHVSFQSRSPTISTVSSPFKAGQTTLHTGSMISI